MEEQAKKRSTFREKFFNDSNESSWRKCFNALWAILFGFIISGIVISFTGNNPFLVFASLFDQGTTTFGNKLISVFVAYLFASLGVAICFKSGLFNIGISGQMMSAGFTTLLIFRSQLLTEDQISGGSIALAFFVAIGIGMLIAAFAGALKAYFGINEVVSTIMLNWIIFFIIKFLVQDYAAFNGQDFLATADSMSSNLSSDYIMPSFFSPQDINNSWYSNYWNWIIISMGLCFVVMIWFVLSKTTLGYKIKMVGLNKDAASYSGTNQKLLTVLVMAISGGLCGIAGFIWYVGQGGQLDVAEQPLLAGFDAIAISLLVFNNPVAITLSSLMYGILSIGSNGLASEFPGMQKEISQVIIGIFIYCAAITVVFSKLRIYTWIKRFFTTSNQKREYVPMTTKLKAYIRYYFKWFGMEHELFVLWKEHHNEWKNINKDHQLKIKQLEEALKDKHHQHKFNIEKISDDEQLFYFDELARIKKQSDLELAKAHYFDKSAIRAKRSVELQNSLKKPPVYKKQLFGRMMFKNSDTQDNKRDGGE